MEWETNTLLTPVSEPGEDIIQDCVVVGAGMSGRCTAGHLKAAGINAIIVERNAAVGPIGIDIPRIRIANLLNPTTPVKGSLEFEVVFSLLI
jgi:heterodisulfide reductase subunit A-like polyferredoxin